MRQGSSSRKDENCDQRATGTTAMKWRGSAGPRRQDRLTQEAVIAGAAHRQRSRTAFGEVCDLVMGPRTWADNGRHLRPGEPAQLCARPTSQGAGIYSDKRAGIPGLTCLISPAPLESTLTPTDPALGSEMRQQWCQPISCVVYEIAYPLAVKLFHSSSYMSRRLIGHRA